MVACPLCRFSCPQCRFFGVLRADEKLTEHIKRRGVSGLFSPRPDPPGRIAEAHARVA